MRPSRSHSPLIATLLGLAAMLALGCDDDSTAPASGAIQVTVSTAGADIDPDGYSLIVDARPGQPLAVNGTMTVRALRAGNHVLQLSGLASNCSASGPSQVTVTVLPRDTVTAAFTVSCVVRNGTIEVTTASSGPDQDPDGYFVSVDGGAGQAIPPNGTLSFTGLNEGQHTVTLSGLATNCTVSQTNPQTVSVVFAQTAGVPFTVACVARTGVIRVVTTTIGSNPDPNGYLVHLDGGAGQPIATNGSVLIAGVREGQHSVLLTEFAQNCRVDTFNPRMVVVAFGETVEVAFLINCGQP